MKVASSIYLVQGCIGNPYLLVENHQITLIDTGIKGSAKRIIAELASIKRDPREITRIILTHSDGDHVGGLAELNQVVQAEIIASPIEAAAIRSGHPSREIKSKGLQRALFSMVVRWFRAKPSKVDLEVSESDSFPILDGLQVLETPGHTPGHISLLIPSVGALFSGDSIQVIKSGYKASSGANTWDQDKALISIHKQQSLNPRIILGGHGWNDQASNPKIYLD